MTTYHRRLRMLRPAANDRSVQTGRQDWSDLHQQRQDWFDVVRGILDAVLLLACVGVAVVLGVVAAVEVLG